MRVLVWVLVLAAFTVGCRSGTVDTVAIENPDVQLDDVAPRPTAVVEAGEAVGDPQSASADTSEPDADDSAAADDRAPDAGEADEADALPDSGGLALADGADVDEDATERRTAKTDVDTPATTDDIIVDLSTVDVGVNPVAADDSWCTVAEKLDNNYRAVNAVDRGDATAVEAVFRQVYDSVELAAQIAPPEIADAAEVERWVWDRVVSLHADANWNISNVPVDQVVELSESNLVPMQAVDDYTATVCG